MTKTMIAPCDDQSAKIRNLNNSFRIEKLKTGSSKIPGCLFLTQGFCSLPISSQQAVLREIVAQEPKADHNNPYAEDDFGVVSIDETSDQPLKFYWRIDYFSDDTCEYGAEDPGVAQDSYRVLTIMEAGEYECRLVSEFEFDCNFTPLFALRLF